MKKGQLLLTILMFIVIILAFVTIINKSFYTAWACIVFISSMMFQFGINSDISEKPNKKEIKPKLNFSKILGYFLFGLLVSCLLFFVYKTAIWDLLKDGWMKYGVIVSFVLANWIIPLFLGNTMKKRFPKLRETLQIQPE